MNASPFANLNRRQLLQLVALVGGSAALAACGDPRLEKPVAQPLRRPSTGRL
ncbi:twin-arginine translocation signal domain-containing protein [Arthrobacter alpinus]|nr:twin-arginine translocation signal domain-containing protein [Arthrobacter alpinus]